MRPTLVLKASLMFGLASAQAVCDDPTYSSFLPLSTDTAAESYCSSSFPIAPSTVTTTIDAVIVTSTGGTTTSEVTVATSTVIETAGTATLTFTVNADGSPANRKAKREYGLVDATPGSRCRRRSKKPSTTSTAYEQSWTGEPSLTSAAHSPHFQYGSKSSAVALKSSSSSMKHPGEGHTSRSSRSRARTRHASASTSPSHKPSSSAANASSSSSLVAPTSSSSSSALIVSSTSSSATVASSTFNSSSTFSTSTLSSSSSSLLPPSTISSTSSTPSSSSSIDLLDQLTTQPSSYISTLCSCIQTPVTSTITATPTSTSVTMETIFTSITALTTSATTVTVSTTTSLPSPTPTFTLELVAAQDASFVGNSLNWPNGVTPTEGYADTVLTFERSGLTFTLSDRSSGVLTFENGWSAYYTTTELDNRGASPVRAASEEWYDDNFASWEPLACTLNGPITIGATGTLTCGPPNWNQLTMTTGEPNLLRLCFGCLWWGVTVGYTIVS